MMLLSYRFLGVWAMTTEISMTLRFLGFTSFFGAFQRFFLLAAELLPDAKSDETIDSATP